MADSARIVAHAHGDDGDCRHRRHFRTALACAARISVAASPSKLLAMNRAPSEAELAAYCATLKLLAEKLGQPAI